MTDQPPPPASANLLFKGKDYGQAKDPPYKTTSIRVLPIWAVQTTALLIMAWLMNGVVLDSLAAGIVSAAVIGLLYALLWPLLGYVLVPFAVLILGIAALLLYGFMVWMAAGLIGAPPGWSRWKEREVSQHG